MGAMKRTSGIFFLVVTGLVTACGSGDETETPVITNISYFTARAKPGAVELSWVNPGQNSFGGVAIERSTTDYPQKRGDGLEIYKGNDQLYLDEDVTDAILYYYSAFTFNKDGVFNTSPQQDSSGTADTVAPGPVTNLSAEAGDNQVTLTWQAPDDTDLVGVQIRRSNRAPIESSRDGDLIGTSNGNQYVDRAVNGNTVNNGTTYYYGVFAYDRSNNLSDISVASATPNDTVVPAPVSNLVAAGGIRTNQIRLNWSFNAAVTNASGIQVRRLKGACPGTIDATAIDQSVGVRNNARVNTTQIFDTSSSVANNNEYCYIVRSFNNGVPVLYSDPVAATGRATIYDAGMSFVPASGVTGTDVVADRNDMWVAGSDSSGFYLSRFNSDGTIDNAFGTLGLVSTSAFSGAVGTGMIVENNAIYLGGGYASASVVWRFSIGGLLDTTFGADYDADSEAKPDGYFRTSDQQTPKGSGGFTVAGADRAYLIRANDDLALLPADTKASESGAQLQQVRKGATGTLYVVGSRTYTVNNTDYSQMAVWSVDTTTETPALVALVNSGTVLNAFGRGIYYWNDAGSEKLLVTGYVENIDTQERDLVVWQFLFTGGSWQLDTGFSSTGYMIIGADDGIDEIGSHVTAAIEARQNNQSLYKIVVSGSRDSVGAVWRFNLDGSQDMSFGEDYDADDIVEGYVALDGNIAAMTLQPEMNNNNTVVLSERIVLIGQKTVDGAMNIWRLIQRRL